MVTEDDEISQQAATRNRGKAFVNSPPTIYDQEPSMVAEDDEMSKDKEIDKLAKDAAYHKEKMILCKKEEAGFQLNAEQANWRDDTDDEPEDQELEAHYMYMAQIQEALVDKLKAKIKDFKTKNKSLESSNNHFKEENNELSKTNQLMYKDLKKFQAELDRYNNVKYASKVEIDCAKAKGDLMSYKMEFEKSFNAYTRKINDLNQIISKIKKELFAHQETIFILSQAKEAQLKFYKTRGDKDIDKVIVLENKIKDLDNIVYKTGQSVQTMNMLNPRLYDIGCYNDNLALMLAPESDEVIRLEKESQSKLSDLSSKQLFKIKKGVDTIIDGVERCKQTIAKR
nr:hypothetical protein [Tanacetum cinerariifolium]